MTDHESSVAIIESTGHVAPGWTDAREQLIRDNFVPKNAPKDMIEAFLALARHRGLAPEEKHVYLIERGGKWTIQTGIDGFRLIADRTGTYAGSDPAVYTYTGDGAVESATVTVWKLVQGQRCPFGATAYVEEYKQQSSQTWQKMPRVMVAKCAEALALRKAFPAQLAGIYEPSEMDQAESPTAPPRMTGGTPPRPGPAKAVMVPKMATKAQADIIDGLRDRLGVSNADVTAMLGGRFKDTTADVAQRVVDALREQARELDDEQENEPGDDEPATLPAGRDGSLAGMPANSDRYAS